jgi:hypothetical protein
LILKNEESLELKVKSLKALATENEAYSPSIIQISDLLISAQIRASDILLENLQKKVDLDTIILDIQERITYITTNVTDGQVIIQLINILQERIQSIQDEQTTRDETGIRKRVTDIQNDIVALN